LNRYFRELVGQIPEATAVVVAPARDAPRRVVAVSDHDASLPRRVRAFAAAAIAAAGEADVIDAHFALYAALPVRRAPARHLPLVVHFHGPWASEAAPAERRGRASSAARFAVEKSVYRRATRAVTLSGAFARVLVRDYGVSPWKIEILPPGVDLDRFTPGRASTARTTLGLAVDTPVVAVVRRLVPRTGVDVLLEAWRALDNGRALLAIAGDGPERGRLEAQAATLGLHNVRFLGAITDHEVATLYRAADLTVVPSTALEGYGLVVLESLASGTPVVVTDSGGLPEAVAGLDAGLVVPAGDADALSARIAGALDGTNPVPSRNRCREHAARFDWAGVGERHRRLYADAVAPPRRPRVLVVDHCARLSGGEIAMLRLLRALPAVDAHFLSFEPGPLLAELGAAGITTEIMAMPERTRDLRRERVGRKLPWRAAVDTTVQVVRLARRTRRLRPDVVHANSLKAGVVAGFAARLTRTPSVWHIRDVVDDDTLPRPAASLVRALARRLPSAIVANSEATLASLRLPAGSGPRRIVIPDPLPGSYFAVGGEPAHHDEPVIGIVGRVAPWKGQHLFLEAFALAFAHGGARARVIGDALFGEDDHLTALRAQAARLGIADRVEFRGFRHDIEAELAELDILVHASVQVEPFGQVVVEGMAAGLAVVAANAGGPAEIVTHGRDGLLVTPGDVDALAGALAVLAADPVLRGRLGSAARASAAPYRADVVAPRFADVYTALGAPR
jgi:glycosyltransferase involved in cell wall biosynthesis